MVRVDIEQTQFLYPINYMYVNIQYICFFLNNFAIREVMIEKNFTCDNFIK